MLNIINTRFWGLVLLTFSVNQVIVYCDGWKKYTFFFHFILSITIISFNMYTEYLSK
jgi:archaellum biogenesis protein FlaJ (TadC family)